ncbi:helix-turn-helix domain-containing protein [Salarchaeum sp. III]|uniref:helix-turn-helix domain-containing protein n=1 Tax=Salarchaeum sp. III TaxID=3107927 RepID=UPI002EDB3B3D
MSVIAEFSVPASEFVLGKALQNAPELSIELDKLVPTGAAIVPYIWVLGTPRDGFEAVLAREPELSNYRLVDELDDRALYRIDWNAASTNIVQVIVDHDAVLQEADGDADAWEFRVRFPDSHALSEFHTACREAELELTVKRLYNPVDPAVAALPELTDAQRELVERAYDEGYFDIPRKITLLELSEKIGISDQAVNERLRRGLSALIAATLKADNS